MSRQDLYDYHYDEQRGFCAICGEKLPDRYHTEIDRYPTRGEDGGSYTEANTRLICLQCSWQLEGNEPNSVYPEITAAYRTFKMWQDLAGSMRRRMLAFQGDLKETSRSPYMDGATLAELDELATYFEEQQKTHSKRMRALVRETDEWEAFLKEAPGCGETLAAFLLAQLDISKAKHASSLWAYFGYDPSEDYNRGKGQLKSVLYAALSISVCTRKTSPYRHIYDRFKDEEVSHGGAVLRVIKIWLAHLWDNWRRHAGLPVSEPWVTENTEHSHVYRAADYGWPL